jgi:aminoglycoside phosphotransferase (APT) family kinase protein
MMDDFVAKIIFSGLNIQSGFVIQNIAGCEVSKSSHYSTGHLTIRKRIVLRNDIQLASKIASRFFNESQISILPVLGKGSVNKVFIVEVAGAKVIVRMRNDNAALDEYTKEAWCIKKAAAARVPVSDVLAIGMFEEHAYMIQTYIAGDEGRNSQLPGSYIWRQLGKYARLIHSIDVAGFGLKLRDLTEGDSRKSWLKYLDYNIESLNEADELLKLNVVTQSQSKIIRTMFESLREKRFSFGLNHGDLSLKNVIVDKSGRVNLLDWGSAEASITPHHDLIQLLKMNMLENDPGREEIQDFLDGYGISQIEFEQMMPELNSLLMLRAFDKLRWAIDWSAGGLGRFVNHAKSVVERCLPRK